MVKILIFNSLLDRACFRILLNRDPNSFASCCLHQDPKGKSWISEKNNAGKIISILFKWL